MAEPLALALLLSIPFAAAALAIGMLLDRSISDPDVRTRFWQVMFLVPILPALMAVLGMVAPATVARPMTILPPQMHTVVSPLTEPAAELVRIDLGQAAAFFLVIAGFAATWRLVQLVARTTRLARLRRCASPAPDALALRLSKVFSDLGVRQPAVVMSREVSEPCLVGIVRPTLLLPASWSESAPDAAEAVFAHEAAHLKRGDHLSLWWDEAVSCLLAFNPLITPARARLRAAREEACDAIALKGRSQLERRAFARAYLDALQPPDTPQPALSFAREPRRLAMRRLKAILTPIAASSSRARLAANLGAVALAAIAAGTAWAATGPERPVSEPPSQEETEALARGYMGDAAYEAQTLAFESATGADFQRFCASGIPGEDGFCAGIIIRTIQAEAQQATPRFCAPEPDPETIRHAVRAVAGVAINAAYSPRDVAFSALLTAYPCQNAGPGRLLVNGALIDAPQGYGPVQIVADEVVMTGPDNVPNYRTAGAAPIRRVAIDGVVQAEGFDYRQIDPTRIERVEIDSRLGHMNFLSRQPG